MAISLDEIVEETRHLPPDVVAELVDRIILARHPAMEPAAETAWHNEIHRRIDDFKTGKVEGVPLEEALARARKIAGL